MTSPLDDSDFTGKAAPFDDLDGLAGTWGVEEAMAFEAAVEPMSEIDESLWIRMFELP